MTELDLQGFMNQYQGESDRGAALIAAAHLDSLLHLLIQSFLVDDESEVAKLLGNRDKWNCPLGTFGARIRAAYCLGLISVDEFHDLRIIQRIRNEFAHELDTVSFNDQPIADRCISLAHYCDQPADRHLADEPRSRFLFVTGMLDIGLRSRIRSSANERRAVQPESTARSF